MKLTIVKADNLVIVDELALSFDLTPYKLPANFWALQWFKNGGEIEYTDKPNEVIKDLSRYQGIIEKHAKLKAEAEAPPPEPTEAEKYAALIIERDSRLAATDWLILRHTDEASLDNGYSLNPDEYRSVLAYRKALRDLPQNSPTSSVWVWPPLPTILE